MLLYYPVKVEKPKMHVNTTSAFNVNYKIAVTCAKLHWQFHKMFWWIIQVAQLSQGDCAMHELLRFAKYRSGIFEPPYWGLWGNVDASCVRRWKKRSLLPIGDIEHFR